MIPFSLAWEPPAEDELAEIWLQSPDRWAVTRAQAKIDQLLKADPIANGAHLSEGLYTIHVPPLRCNYTIDVANRHVEVTWVR